MKVNEIVVNEGVISRMIQRNFGKPGTEPGMQFDPAQVQAGVIDEIIRDWSGLVKQYNTAHPGLLSRAYVYQRELDKFLKSTRKIDASKLQRYNLAGTDPASVKTYIQQVKAAHDVAARTNVTRPPAPTTTTPAPSQLPTGVAFPTADTSVTDKNGHAYTYTIPAGSTGLGQWSYNGTAITEPADIQILNKLNLNAVNAAKTKP